MHQSSRSACKAKRGVGRTASLTFGGCNKVFSMMANLERHHATGTCEGNRTLEEMSCPTCGKLIKDKANLERHQATHK